jgi:hypothetical protein
MREHEKGAVGLGNRHTPEFCHKQQRNNSPHYPQGQAIHAGRRSQQLNARAAAVMRALSLADAKSAMRCLQAEERAELRHSSAIMHRWAERLRAGVA